ncbi:MAG: hypothetical protein U1F43_21955 [Myxococcota bacterium]
MERSSIGVIYHENCTDGACAAWELGHLAAAHDVVGYPAPPARMPAHVGQHDLVFVADTCLPKDDLARLDARTRLGVWVLDHHQTNRAIVCEHPRGVFDLARSGAGLAWDEGARILRDLGLRRDLPPRPWFIDYVEDRDLWRHALPDSQAVNAAISAADRTPASIEALWQATLAEADRAATVARHKELGRGILVGIADAVRVAVDQAIPFELHGHRGLAVASSSYASEIGHGLTTRGALAAIWYVSIDSGPGRGGLLAQLSFRSRADLPDVARLAESIGGGGHRNASGAVVPLEQWLACLRSGQSNTR